MGDVQRFYSECFIPARSKYLSADPTTLSGAGQALVAPGNTSYGPSDVDWMGSQLFRTEPGYYDEARAYNPVPGFAVDFSRDVDYYNPATATELPPPEGNINPEWGRPTCKEWWEDSSQGLRGRMVNHSGTWQELLSRSGNLFTSLNADQKLDAVARLAATRTNPQYVDPSGLMSQDFSVSSVMRSVGGAVSSIGLFFISIFTSISFVPLITGLFMMQALILMGLYMFLPLITFLSGFDLKVMFIGAMAIFTVKFWAVMWALATWVDAHLFNAMYPNIINWSQVAEIFTTGEVLSTVHNGYKRALLNILLIGMIAGLPALWTGMMAWIGLNVGQSLDTLARSADSTANSTVKTIPIANKFIKKK